MSSVSGGLASFSKTLAEHDLEIIKTGCIVLEAPKVIMKALEAIRNDPGYDSSN